ncbi:hypothetical protein EGW08_020676 [Elysia chlorotica]|uniref:TatD related DNase n=1 Tax=Elysia chlorotica TaxID=188477 RepID=A0A433SQM6_ELYCH|nr:hypothetical protein EGW08_020676 [Elysia chlorotica]
MKVGATQVVTWGSSERRQPVGPGFDSHFHVDRGFTKAPARSLDRVLSAKVDPQVPIDLKGGCVVFCDPANFPSRAQVQDISRRPGFKVAVGIHPKHAGNVGESHVCQLKQIVDHPCVAALGEVGLDFPAKIPIPQQVKLLEECLNVAPRNKPVVLHIRPRGQVAEQIDEDYEFAFKVVRSIQLHCFSGGEGIKRMVGGVS